MLFVTNRIIQTWPKFIFMTNVRIMFAVFLFYSLLKLQRQHLFITLPETNIVPENRPSQKKTSIPTIHFQVRAVRFRECIPYLPLSPLLLNTHNLRGRDRQVLSRHQFLEMLLRVADQRFIQTGHGKPRGFWSSGVRDRSFFFIHKRHRSSWGWCLGVGNFQKRY